MNVSYHVFLLISVTFVTQKNFYLLYISPALGNTKSGECDFSPNDHILSTSSPKRKDIGKHRCPEGVDKVAPLRQSLISFKALTNRQRIKQKFQWQKALKLLLFLMGNKFPLRIPFGKPFVSQPLPHFRKKIDVPLTTD